MQTNASLNPVLLKSQNYREFLEEAYNQMRSSSKKKFSFTVLAKKIGCRSKSYPREVMTGRRLLSNMYAPRFADAFGLRGDAKRLFLKLVEKERALDSKVVESDIIKLRRRLQNKIDHVATVPSDLFSETRWIDVYAALGSTDHGATLAEIGLRTGLKDQLLQAILAQMQSKGLVTLDADGARYFAQVQHHFFEGVNADSIFQQRFLEILDRVKNRAKISFQSQKELYYCSTISVDSSRLPELRKELQDLMNRYVQDAEAAEGDRLSDVLVSLI